VYSITIKNFRQRRVNEMSLQFSEILCTSFDSKVSPNILNSADFNDDSQWTPVNREAETMTRLDTDSKGERAREDNSAPRVVFFPLREFHVWLESSSPGVLFITALNRHAVKEKECSACVSARVLASLSSAFVRRRVLRPSVPLPVCALRTRVCVASRDASP